ncbi:TetR/AcrR family transcriptional regulator [Turicimonas muris]|uniref:TetR/AcrR family transcriptional regulator n=2 Tax=Sutterellaceae TaxID=995019 RepID=UPI002599B16D|nr:TetR/AcrR family transcriptional regulator [Turicimonas muris]
MKTGFMREKILKGAIKLFLERGIDKVSTRDLTEYLGISRSHIYHYFKDWHSLSLEAVEGFLNNELEEFCAIIEPLSAKAKLRELIDGMITDKPDPSRKLYSSLWLLSSHNENYKCLVQTCLAKWQQVLTDIIQCGMNEQTFHVVDAKRVARQLDAMLLGYSEYLSNPASEDTVKNAREDIDDFIQKNILTIK